MNCIIDEQYCKNMNKDNINIKAIKKKLKKNYYESISELNNNTKNVRSNLVLKTEDLKTQVDHLKEEHINNFSSELEELKNLCKRYNQLEKKFKVLDNPDSADSFEYLNSSIKLKNLIDQEFSNLSIPNGQIPVFSFLGNYVDFRLAKENIKSINFVPRIDLSKTNIEPIGKTDLEFRDKVKFNIQLKGIDNQIVDEPNIIWDLKETNGNVELFKNKKSHFNRITKSLILSFEAGLVGEFVVIVELKMSLPSDDDFIISTPTMFKKQFPIKISPIDLSPSFQVVPSLNKKTPVELKKHNSLVVCKQVGKVVLSNLLMKPFKSYRFVMQIKKLGVFCFGIQNNIIQNKEQKWIFCKLMPAKNVIIHQQSLQKKIDNKLSKQNGVDQRNLEIDTGHKIELIVNLPKSVLWKNLDTGETQKSKINLNSNCHFFQLCLKLFTPGSSIQFKKSEFL
ncbi:hypothetical protein M0812_07050 [Anaeramoeba flamelloides]|uniref:Uncharacterized protein n=1 Tax=Anaeramoeba flamelloides TaxID=1746091 RepID=A0AAV8ABB4_9EUKA|nr:hypothetical protein M0812_07050 [Anaeramoeba flamelloides]